MAAPSSGTGVLRLFVYLGCLSMATAYGIFFTLPLYIKALGGDESVVGNILLAGAFGTLGCVGFANQLLKAFSLNLCVVVGALLYAVGAAIFAFVEGMGAWVSPISSSRRFRSICVWSSARSCMPSERPSSPSSKAFRRSTI